MSTKRKRKTSRDKLIQAIQREQKIIADSRDKLRDLISDVDAICYNADEAVSFLDTAVDCLSQNL